MTLSRIVLVLAVSMLIAIAIAPSTVTAEGTTYGQGLSGTEVVKISELLDNPDGYVGQTVRVEGLVTDVCPKRGCWIEIASDREFETLRLKVDDGVIVFPLDAKGKRTVAEGVFTKIELTPEQALQHARHLAEERGEAFDPSAAGELPTVMYQIQGKGAVIR